MLEDLRFRAGIDRGGGFIQHQNIGFTAHKGARQRNFLPLTARKLPPVLEPLAELSVIAARELLDEFGGTALGGGTAPGTFVVESAYVACTDVFTHQHLITGEVLKNNADALPQGGL